jgi:hypothetical protein
MDTDYSSLRQRDPPELDAGLKESVFGTRHERHVGGVRCRPGASKSRRVVVAWAQAEAPPNGAICHLREGVRFSKSRIRTTVGTQVTTSLSANRR